MESIAAWLNEKNSPFVQTQTPAFGGVKQLLTQPNRMLSAGLSLGFYC